MKSLNMPFINPYYSITEITCSAPSIDTVTSEINYCSPPFHVGISCAFHCKNGYQMAGHDEQTLICGLNAEWSEEPMTCEGT